MSAKARKVRVRALVRSRRGLSDHYIDFGHEGTLQGRRPGHYLIKWDGVGGHYDHFSDEIEIIR